MAHINLLPWREELRKRREKEFFTGLAVFAGIGAAIAGGWFLFMSSQIEYQQSRNKLLKSEIAALEVKIREINELKALKSKLLSRMEVIENLQSDRGAAVEFFNTIVTTLPSGVYLTNIKQAGKSLEIEGVAESNGRVSEYLRSLSESTWIVAPRLGEIRTREVGGVRVSEFKLRAKFGPPKVGDEEGGES